MRSESPRATAPVPSAIRSSRHEDFGALLLGPGNARKADENFLSSASQRMADTMQIARTAESVWSDLTSDDVLSWCRLLGDVRARR